MAEFRPGGSRESEVYLLNDCDEVAVDYVANRQGTTVLDLIGENVAGREDVGCCESHGSKLPQ